MQASVPSVGQDETAVRLSARLLELPLISEFGAPGVTGIVQVGKHCGRQAGILLRAPATEFALMRLLSAVWLTRE